MTDTQGNDDRAGDKPRENDNKQSATRAEAPPSNASADTDQGKAGAAASASTTEQGPDSSARDGKASQQAAANGNKTAARKQSSSSEGSSAKSTNKQRKGAGSAGTRRADKSATGGRRHRGGLAIVIAVIALIVAIVAIAGAAWVWRQGEHRADRLEARIAQVRKSVAADVQSSIRPKLDALRSRIKSVAESGAQREQQLEQLQATLDQTRMQLAGISQRLQGDVRRWQLQQVEHLLVVANRRLQLYREPSQASAALELASHMIARLNDPRLFEVRKSIINSIAALEALPSPDIEGMALTLSAFIKQVPSLPLASDLPDSYTPQAASAQTEQGGATGPLGVDWSSGWQRFVNSVGQALHSMVTIRRVDGTQVALLPPDQVYFLTQNLILQLRSARLALLEGNATLYRQSLSTAVDWLQQYFDTQDPAVKSMIERLGQLQNVKLDWQAPDISGGLRALRDYMQSQGQAGRQPAHEPDSGHSSSTHQPDVQ